MSLGFAIGNSFRLTLHVIAFICALARQAVNVANNGAIYLYYFGLQQENSTPSIDISAYVSSGKFAFGLSILGTVLVGIGLLVMANVPLHGRRVSIVVTCLNGVAMLSFIISLGITSSNASKYNDKVDELHPHHTEATHFELSRGSSVLAATIPLLMVSSFLMLSVFVFRCVRSQGIVLPSSTNNNPHGLQLGPHSPHSSTYTTNGSLSIRNEEHTSLLTRDDTTSTIQVGQASHTSGKSPLRIHFTNPPRICYLAALLLQSICGGLAVAGCAAAPQQLQQESQSDSGGVIITAWHYYYVSTDASSSAATDLVNCAAVKTLLPLAGAFSLCGSIFALLALITSSLVTLLRRPSLLGQTNTVSSPVSTTCSPNRPAAPTDQTVDAVTAPLAAPSFSPQHAYHISTMFDTSYFIVPAAFSGLSAVAISAATIVLLISKGDTCIQNQNISLSSSIVLASLAVPSSLLCILLTVIVHRKALRLLLEQIYGFDILEITFSSAYASPPIPSASNEHNWFGNGQTGPHGQLRGHTVPRSATATVANVANQDNYFNRASTSDFGEGFEVIIN